MCTLKVRGADPRLAQLPRTWGMRPSLTIHGGQRIDGPSGRPWKSARAKEAPGVHGFHVGVSDRGWDDLPGQFGDALDFLRAHRDALRSLADLRPDRAVLDFPAETDPSTRQGILFDVVVPVALARASAELGIAVEITLYFAVRDRASGPRDSETHGPT